MAVVCIQDLENYNLSGNIRDLIFSTDAESMMFALFLLDENQKKIEILHNTYYPDENGLITICDLRSVLETYIGNELISSFIYAVGENIIFISGDVKITDGFSREFQVQLSKYELESSQFIENYFLSLLEEKITALSRSEYLSLKISKETILRAVSLYKDENGKLLKENKDLKTLTDINHVLTVDVSPSQFEKEGYELLGYTIVAEKRVFSYQIDRIGNQPAASFLFLNPFGVKETIYIPGVDLSKGKYEKEDAYINGVKKVYKTTFSRQHEISTAIIPHEEVRFMETFFVSEEHYLLSEDGSTGKAVILSEITDEVSSASDALHAFKFTWEIAQMNQKVFLKKKPSRIFDNSFDETFN